MVTAIRACSVPQQVKTVTTAEMIEMVLSQFACRGHLTLKLGLLGPGVQIATARLACERQGVPVPVPGGSLLQHTCATALRAGWAINGPTDAERADWSSCRQQTSHDRAGVAVAFCAVEPEDCGQWTVKRVVCPAPTAQQCPHAAAG